MLVGVCEDADRGCDMRIMAGTVAISFAMLFGVCLGVPRLAQAQMFQCPPPSVPISGGGGMECQCPDGSLAGLYSGCPSQPQQAACPAGYEQCGEMCCGPGNYCSTYGCIQRGSVECGGYYCNPGMKCALNHTGCYPADVVDCGNYSCQPGNVCGSRRTCLPQGAVDCGSGTSCQAGLKCSRDGKRCLAADAIDCGSYNCSSGQKCGSGNKCLARTDVDCGGGKSCPADHLCIRGGAECLTKQEIADRAAAEKQRKEEEIAEKKRVEEERKAEILRKEEERKAEIARKKQEEIEAKQRAEEAKRLAAEAEAKRKADEAAQREAELQARRRGINSVTARPRTNTVRLWRRARERRARPLPVPGLPPGSVEIRPAPPPPAPVIVEPKDITVREPGIPAALRVPPLKWAGKFFFTEPKGDMVCSAQFIAPNVVLTAAHCVRDADSGAYYSNFMFALQYHDGASSRRYGWKCVATPDGWVKPPGERQRWDYAMMLVDENSPTGYFGWQANWQDTSDSVYKIGYPVGIAGGQEIQVEKGPIELHDGLIELHHGNPNDLKGSSGGAWVARFSDSDASNANYVISLTSFYFTNAPDVAYGPALGPDFKRLLDYVSSGCQ